MITRKNRRDKLIEYTHCMVLLANLYTLRGDVVSITHEGAINLIKKFKIYGLRYFLYHFGVKNYFKLIYNIIKKNKQDYFKNV